MVIPNAGWQSALSVRTEKNMKLLCYVICYHVQSFKQEHLTVLCVYYIGNCPLIQIFPGRRVERSWRSRRPTLNDKEWPRTLELIQNWLQGCNGQMTDIPLALSFERRWRYHWRQRMIHRITICLGWTMNWLRRSLIIEAVAVTGDITYYAVNGARSLLLAGPQDRVGEDRSIDMRSCLQNVHSYGSKILWWKDGIWVVVSALLVGC